ncbi:hypothetical protein GCM10010381_10220 [Streptomyces xantholiticus]|nr:hypothetical protein GCM10010381_10220 [Streptomyces xantholiticus]
MVAGPAEPAGAGDAEAVALRGLFPYPRLPEPGKPGPRTALRADFGAPPRSRARDRLRFGRTGGATARVLVPGSPCPGAALRGDQRAPPRSPCRAPRFGRTTGIRPVQAMPSRTRMRRVDHGAPPRTRTRRVDHGAPPRSWRRDPGAFGPSTGPRTGTRAGLRAVRAVPVPRDRYPLGAVSPIAGLAGYAASPAN